MSSQTLSRNAIHQSAVDALVITLFAAAWVPLTDLANSAILESLPPPGSLLILVITGAVTVVLVALSLSLRHVARHLPPVSLSPEVVAQRKRRSRRDIMVVGIVAIVAFSESMLLDYLHHSELTIPVLGLTIGCFGLLSAFLNRSWLGYSIAGATVLFSGVAVLALTFGMMLGGAYTWSVIVDLGIVVCFWLGALYRLYIGRRLLYDGMTMSTSRGQS